MTGKMDRAWIWDMALVMAALTASLLAGLAAASLVG